MELIDTGRHQKEFYITENYLELDVNPVIHTHIDTCIGAFLSSMKASVFTCTVYLLVSPCVIVLFVNCNRYNVLI